MLNLFKANDDVRFRILKQLPFFTNHFNNESKKMTCCRLHVYSPCNSESDINCRKFIRPQYLIEEYIGNKVAILQSPISLDRNIKNIFTSRLFDDVDYRSIILSARKDFTFRFPEYKVTVNKTIEINDARDNDIINKTLGHNNELYFRHMVKMFFKVEYKEKHKFICSNKLCQFNGNFEQISVHIDEHLQKNDYIDNDQIIILNEYEKHINQNAII